MPALGVADQRGFRASLCGERRGAGTGERALRLPVDILHAREQVGAFTRGLGGGFERHGGGEEPSLAALVAVVAGAKGLHVGPGLVGPEIHLPVGREEEVPHAASSAATPGRVFPSRNSSEAPPPVDTWVNLSSSPRTAAAESPPPTTVVAPRLPASISASATARVPPSKGGVSNTPTGPFQNTVL